MYQCAICQEAISGTDWLCHWCANEYGLADISFRAWPDWAKALKDEEEKRRRGMNTDLFWRCESLDELGEHEEPVGDTLR